MKTYSEIKEIAYNEARHPDSVHDIKNEDVSRRELFIAAFCYGYEMCQGSIEPYEEEK